MEDIQVKIAQLIAAVLMIVLFYSAPVVNILDGQLVLSVLSSKILRNQFIQVLNLPLCISALLFYAVIIIAENYSVARSNKSRSIVNRFLRSQYCHLLI